jgi:hypothetical protein
MRELLYPRTDAGVAAQAATLFPAYALLVIAARRHRDVQVLVLGLALCTAGFFGLRMLH